VPFWQTQSLAVNSALQISGLFCLELMRLPGSYGDFSGYSDIARGSAQLLGFHFMVNFRQPFLANRLQDSGAAGTSV